MSHSCSRPYIDLGSLLDIEIIAIETFHSVSFFYIICSVDHYLLFCLVLVAWQRKIFAFIFIASNKRCVTDVCFVFIFILVIVKMTLHMLCKTNQFCGFAISVDCKI